MPFLARCLMSLTPNYVPREYKTITPVLLVKDAERALKFYNNAFGAETIMKLIDPNGKVVHAEMKIEDMILMLTEDDEIQPEGVSGIIFQIYTGDANALLESALAAGAEELRPIEKKFYGDKAGRIKDPFGYQWIIATHVEDVSPKELKRRFDELYS